MTALTSEDSEILIIHINDMWNILHDSPIKASQKMAEVLYKMSNTIKKLDDYILNSICESLYFNKIPMGKMILEQGKKSDNMHIFYKGKIELIWEDENDSKF